MIVLLRKWHLLAGLSLLIAFAAMAAVLWTGHGPSAAVFSPASSRSVTVVIDPGHGGEDGGAVSADGRVKESALNLEIARRLEALLSFTGQRTAMTRSEDVSIHTEAAKTLRQKKVSDLRNRVETVNGLERAVLLSIHQNSLPSSPGTRGAQAFWNDQSGAETVANSIQTALNTAINPGREKHPKPIPSSIYLMKHITAPGILVECGFLSHAEETAQLQTPSHQLRLAVAIAAGFHGAKEEIP